MPGERTIEFASVDWEADAPRSIFFDDIYFSGGGAEETRHVFIDGNDLTRRLAAADRFCVGELGFGSGLNFLSTSALWRRVRRPGAALYYFSVEKYPMRAEDLRRAGAAWPEFTDGVDALARAYPPPIAGFHQLTFGDGVTLTLGFGEAAALLACAEAKVDAWFLDGFSPAKNPAMWSEAVFRDVARLSAPGATAATFTVAGAVRRGLEAAGFVAEKRAGYGRKKEMLAATIGSPLAVSMRAPWFPRARRALAAGARVAVIGGGIAGASLADAASASGLTPVIIDPNGLASGASGNAAGLIMPRLDLGDGAAARFFIAAYAHALRRLDGAGAFNPCGVFQPSLTEDVRQWAEKAVAARLLPKDMMTGRDGGLYFPQGGVVDPPAYVRALAGGVDLIKERALSIEARPDGVRVRLADGESIDADAAVLANGADALRFVEARTLPLARVGGQIDWFPEAPSPAFAHAFGPYAAPAPQGGLVIGATYDKLGDGADPHISVDAARANIAAVAAVLPDLAAALDAAHSVPRASVRCQTPDRLPIAGPAPDFHFYGAAYDDLRVGKVRDYPAGEMVPNVFLLTGLGSRGLVTAPLCAAMIVAEMTGAPSPVERDIAEALHPARFFIRDLKRARAPSKSRA